VWVPWQKLRTGSIKKHLERLKFLAASILKYAVPGSNTKNGERQVQAELV
jgi:hypothetical protein